MSQNISLVTLVVDDYDKAIAFYTHKLHFVVLEDTVIDDNKRWVRIAPNQHAEFSLLLAQATDALQKTRIGNQTGGRVFLFLHTTDFENDYKNLLANEITIIREPKTEPYGKVLVFEDCYGNLWDLIGPSEQQTEKYYTTGIVKVLAKENVDTAKIALLELQKHTHKEEGNLLFDVQQSKEDPTLFVIWECFKNETEFQKHLASKHLKNFMELHLVTLVNGYETIPL